MQPINGVQQAGVDRATRMVQMLEQRHLQIEMAAAAFAREDRRHAQEVAKLDKSERSHTDDDDEDEGGRRRRRGHGHQPPPQEDDGGSGHRVDLSA